MVGAEADAQGGTMDVEGVVPLGGAGTGEVIDAGALATDASSNPDGSVDKGSPGDASASAGPGASPAGCALIMHLDEASWSGNLGEVMDTCGNNHGTAVKRLDSDAVLPATTAAGYFAGAGDFNANHGCIQVADDPSLRATTAFTLAAWIFPTALDPGSNGIIAKRTGYQSNSSYAMFLWSEDSVTYQLWADIGVERFRGKLAFSTNRWYHVAVAFNGDLPVGQRMRLYVDGVPDGEFPTDATTVPRFEAPLFVGCLPLSGPAQEFAGKIDEAVVWTRALGSQEIHSLYTARAPL